MPVRVRRRFDTLVEVAGFDADRARSWVIVREAPSRTAAQTSISLAPLQARQFGASPMSEHPKPQPSPVPRIPRQRVSSSLLAVVAVVAVVAGTV